MAREIINVGAAPNDGQGDPIRTSFQKTNNNFGELYSRVQDSPPVTLTGSVGDVAGMVAYDSEYYYYCFQNWDGSNIIWNQVPQAANAQVTLLTASGNITGAYFFGDGSGLTNVPAGAPTSVVNGTSNIVIAPSGNIVIAANGVPNIATFTDQGRLANGDVSSAFLFNGYARVFGNVVGSNIRALGPGGGAGGSISATGNIIGADIFSLGSLNSATLSLSGNVTSPLNLSGNLTVGGNVSMLSPVVGNISVTGAVIGANILTAGSMSAAGNVTGQYLLGDGGFISNVTVVSNVAVSQIANGTTVIAVESSGGNVSFTVGGAGVATLSTAGAEFTGNISATGTVTGGTLFSTGTTLSTGNITGGNLNTGGAVFADGNLSGLNVIAYQTMSAAGNVSAGNLILSGLITGATTVSAVGNIDGGNINTAGQVNATSNIQGGNLRTTGQVSATGNITGGNLILSGLVTGVTAFSASGNITGGNVNAGQLSAIGNVSGGSLNTTGTIINTGVATTGTISATGNITGGNLTTAGVVSAGGNITGANILTSGLISATGSLTAAGILTINATNGPTAIVNGGSNAVGNIGSSTKYFNTVFAKATSAQYADLAECYLSDQIYAPGTVLSFGGKAELTMSSADQDPRVAGVVSTKPAYQMNSGLEGDFVVTLALTGRVPCQVQGSVSPGDMMVSAGNGRARAEQRPAMGTVIGKALEAFDGELGIIEVVVGRL